MFVLFIFHRFCDDGSLNILGDAVDICVPHEEKKDATTKTVGDAVATERETVCGPKVADALCILLGFERSFHDDIKTEPAKPGEPVVSLTGDYCLRKGLYSKTLPSPSELESLEGEPCEKLSRLACIRTIDTIEASLALGMQELELDVLDPAPAEGSEIATGKKASELATEAMDDTEGENEVEQAEEQVAQTQTGPGRKMMQFQN